MVDSIFTKIIKGEVPSHRIYEDDKVIAFLDVHPLAPGHTLVVPKTQVDHLWDLDDDTYAYLFETSKHLSLHIRSVLEPARVGLVVEGFGVPHAHLHLVPIENGSDLKKKQDQDSPIDNEALADMARKLAVETNLAV